MKQLKFYVMADPHFFDTALGCSGKEYEEFMHYEQKCFAETESINKSVFEFLKNADEADIVLIAGDLAFNGERKSHEGFIRLLYDLKNSGKKIYVVTADHDFKWKREDTFAFGEKGRYSPEHTERDELPELYRNFGFGDTIAIDKEHLSYVAQLSDDVRLMALNCDLKKDGKYYFFDEQLEWIKEQAEKAREDNQTIVAMCHYPILPGQPLFSVISSVLIRDAHKFATFLADNGIHIIFTGHMHNQSINEFITEKGNKLYDITTGSVIADPAFIRLVTVVDEKTVDIKSIPAPDFEWDTDDCKKYLSDRFDSMIMNLIIDMRDDTGRAMRKLGIKDKGVIKKVLRLAGKVICKVKVGTLSRLLFIQCDKSIKNMRALDYATEVVRGVFEGNQTFVEGTPKGDLWLNLLRRLGFIFKKTDLKGWDGKKADLSDLLKNSAGNYDIDDYNATLTIK